MLMWPRISDCAPKRIKRTKIRLSAARTSLFCRCSFGGIHTVILGARNCIEKGAREGQGPSALAYGLRVTQRKVSASNPSDGLRAQSTTITTQNWVRPRDYRGPKYITLDIGAESGVVSQVPTVVIGIFVNDDGIRPPNSNRQHSRNHTELC